MALPYKLGLQEVGSGVFAYLQPNGGWGLSNAGLITHAGRSLLVDTLFDRFHTERMLAAMASLGAAGRAIEVVVNTHANGDHCYGNFLLPEARILATEAATAEMLRLPPRKLAALMKAARVASGLGGFRTALARGLGAVGLHKGSAFLTAAPMVLEAFHAFDFRATPLRAPSETFHGDMHVDLGGRDIHVIEVGPAHTAGDAIVHVPDAGVVFTGDVLFSNGHPIAWAGPLSSWRRACERILSLHPAVVVPGHGPITDAAGVRRMSDYFLRLEQIVDAGLASKQSATEIALHAVRELDADRGEPERLITTVMRLCEERSPNPRRFDAIDFFAAMTRFRAAMAGGGTR
jgi:cyclase